MRVWSEALKCSRSRAASHETVKLNLIHTLRSTSLNLYLDLWRFRETQLRLSILRRNDGRKFHRWGAKEKNARSPYPLRMKLSAKSKQRVWKIFILREYVIKIVSKKKLWWCTLVRKFITFGFFSSIVTEFRSEIQILDWDITKILLTRNSFGINWSKCVCVEYEKSWIEYCYIQIFLLISANFGILSYGIFFINSSQHRVELRRSMSHDLNVVAERISTLMTTWLALFSSL